ncbi:hypothetical protein [Thauera sp.]|uniref:hypothetical protein n=1 Tax=Thauera sp. TaxID=1905334 RepID=UPI00258104CC|nr:hypothetical protein [Thauera sp.]
MNRFSPVRLPLSRPVRFGDTSHGIYSAATGQITTPTPDAVQIACPEPQPFGTDSFVLRIPGTPAVPERTPEEIAADDAAGRTWINYGIISGFRRRLYGANLSDTSPSPAQGWIYVDEDGGRWLVRARFADPGLLRLTFRRFGHFEHGQPIGIVVQTVDVPCSIGGDNASFPTYAFAVNPSGRPVRATLEAISSTGRRAVVLAHRYEYTRTFASSETAAVFLGSGRPLTVSHPSAPGLSPGGFEIRLAGVPPACTVTAHSLLPQRAATAIGVPFTAWLGTGTAETLAPSSGVTNPGETPRDAAIRLFGGPGVYVSGVTPQPGTVSEPIALKLFAGAYYDEADALQLVSLDVTGTLTTAFAITTPTLRESPAIADDIDTNYLYTATMSRTIDAVIRLSCAPTMSIPFVGSYLETAVRAQLVADSTYSLDVSYNIAGASNTISQAGALGPPTTNYYVGWMLGSVEDVQYSVAEGDLYGSLPRENLNRSIAFIGQWGDVNYEPLRFGSRCWGVMLRIPSASPPIRLVALASPTHHKAVLKTGTAASDFGWAGSNPITGEIVDGDTSRCFL